MAGLLGWLRASIIGDGQAPVKWRERQSAAISRHGFFAAENVFQKN